MTIEVFMIKNADFYVSTTATKYVEIQTVAMLVQSLLVGLEEVFYVPQLIRKRIPIRVKKSKSEFVSNNNIHMPKMYHLNCPYRSC